MLFDIAYYFLFSESSFFRFFEQKGPDPTRPRAHTAATTSTSLLLAKNGRNGGSILPREARAPPASPLPKWRPAQRPQSRIASRRRARAYREEIQESVTKLHASYARWDSHPPGSQMRAGVAKELVCVPIFISIRLHFNDCLFFCPPRWRNAKACCGRSALSPHAWSALRIN